MAFNASSLLRTPLSGLPYWMNPDGTPRALCAAPAGPDHEHYAAFALPRLAPAAAAGSPELEEERPPSPGAAPRRPVLNPEEEQEEDEEAPPSPVAEPRPAPVEPPVVEPVQPLPWPRPPQEYQWTVWEVGPEPVGVPMYSRGELHASGDTVKEWRFKKVQGRWRHMIQVKLWSGDTVTQMAHPGALQAVRTKQRELTADKWTVEVDHEESHGWSPQCISFSFDKEDNALAFHNALLTQLSN